MERTPDTSSAPDVRNGRDLADSLYRKELAAAKTVGDARAKIATLVQKVGGNGDAGKRLAEIKTSVDKVSGGGAHDTVKLEDQVGGSDSVLGMNKLGTKDSLLRRDQMNPEEIVQRTRFTMDTVLHENDDEVGHAGQDPNALPTLAVIDEHGQKKDATTVVEGNVVANVSAKLGQRREGLPQKTYQEGADLVEGIGRETVDSYVRKGGANVGKNLQTEIWRKQAGINFSTMLEQGAQIGMTEDQVRKAAQELGRLPKEPQMSGALAA